MDVSLSMFEYLYRDGNNYKAWGSLLLSGVVTQDSLAAIRSSLEFDLLFVPEQLGIPSIREQLYQYSDGPTEDDHCYHEFVDLRAATQSDLKDDTKVFCSVDELVDRFARHASRNRISRVL